ncbi:MAG: universal stress protein [Myxococcota bacterium]
MSSPARYRRILVASDYSEPSLAAIRHASAWARAFGADLELVHAFLPSHYAKQILPHASDLRGKLEQAAHDELLALRNRCAPDHEQAVLTAVEAEHPATAICQRAEASEADLVVVGTHGRTGIARMLIGSVAEGVARHAPCDVLTVPATVLPGGGGPKSEEDASRSATGRTTASPPRRVIASTDFSSTARRGLDAAHQLARQLETETVVAHFVDDSVPALSVGAFPLEDLTERKRHAWDALSSLRAERFGDGADVATWVDVSSSPADALVRLATEREADLIVLSTHGRTGLASLLIGSVAERVIRHADCPVLAVRGRKGKEQDD